MESILTPEVVGVIVAAVFGQAGATWLVLKVRLNGARDDITEIKADQKAILHQVADHGERVRVLESWVTKLPCVGNPAEYWRHRRHDDA